jgi:chromosome segregation ATPase
LQGEVERLKNPPSLEKAQEYFATSDNSAQILQKFPNAQTALLNQVKTLRKAMSDEFGYIHDPNVKLGSLRNHRYNWEQAIKSMEKEAVSIETTLRSMPADWPKRAEREARLSLLRETDMPVLREEISKLNDFYAAFEFQAKPKAELEKILKAKEAELARAQTDLSALQKQVDDMEAEQKKIDEILNVDGTISHRIRPTRRSDCQRHRQMESGRIRQQPEYKKPPGTFGRNCPTIHQKPRKIPSLAAIHGHPLFGNAL